MTYRPFWIVILCLVVTILSITLVIVRYDCCESTGADTPDLILKNSDLASWIEFTNAGSSLLDDTSAGDILNYRPGLLFQLGEHPGDTAELKHVELHMSGGSTVILTPTMSAGSGDIAFDWIDLFSPRTDTSNPTDAITVCESLSLSPHFDYSNCDGSPCSAPTFCEDWNAFSEGTEFGELDSGGGLTGTTVTLAKGCLRNRKLHTGMNVQAIITYWQGQNGFRTSSKQLTRQNETKFYFDDEYTVRVYHYNSTTCTMEPVDLGSGTVTQIVVVEDTGDIGDAIRYDPPWP